MCCDSADERFSALQRAENSSITSTVLAFAADARVSVLFSEPKIPQLIRRRAASLTWSAVSVLFSEPKIPQFKRALPVLQLLMRFSALQRAENSSIYTVD